jgi:hypothetical protein
MAEAPTEADLKKEEEEKKKLAEVARISHLLRNACYNNNEDEVKSLLERNADPSLKDDGLGETALHYAALPGHMNICELLIASGAKIDVESIRGQKAWDKAMPNGELAGNMEIVYFLKEAYFKGLDAKARKTMMEEIYDPFAEAEVKELKEAGDETADKIVARLAPLAQWKSLEDPDALKVFLDAVFEKTGVKTDITPFVQGGLGEATLDTMNDWYFEYGVEKAPEPAEGEEGAAAEGGEATEGA